MLGSLCGEKGITLDRVESRFREWRSHRKKRTRIPRDLWDLAVSLSKDYSVAFLCKKLCLNHSALTRRVPTFTSSLKSEPPPSLIPKASSDFPFIEVPFPPKAGKGGPFAEEVSPYLEWESPEGFKMRILGSRSTVSEIHGYLSFFLKRDG